MGPSACDRLISAWGKPNEELAVPIGNPGYTLPHLDGLEWFALDKVRSEGCVHVSVREGSNNWLVAPRDFSWNNYCRIAVHGAETDNVIVIGHDSSPFGEFQFFGSRNLVIIGAEVTQPSHFTSYFWCNDGLLFWGRGSTSNGTIFNIQGDKGKIVVGDDCMFARGITVRDSDMHAVVDMDTGAWLNPSSNVLIEPHVWISEEAWILRGGLVGFGAIIGGKSIVTKPVPRFTTVAGAPAKVVRSNVSWDRHMMPLPETRQALRDLERRLQPFVDFAVRR